MERNPVPNGRRVVDVGLILAAAVVMIAGTRVLTLDSTPPAPAGWLLLVTAPLLLWFRRASPTLVLVGTIVVGLVYDALDNPGAFYTVAIVIAVFTAAAQGFRWVAVGGIAAATAAFVMFDVLWDTGHRYNPEGVLWFAGWLLAAMLLGEVARSRADYVAASEERARQEERGRQEEALRREGEERMRIARELHDILAHSISIITVQAGVAAHHLDTNPDETRQALQVVRETGKKALRELRSSLGVLRADDAAPPRSPTPGLADLDELVADTENTGLQVRLKRIGDLDMVPPDVGLAVYRVVQEGLTNVTRHAEATEAEVTIERRRGELLLRVDDDGNGTLGTPPPGLGITGMRERLGTLGGTLKVGPRPIGGFRLEGWVPLEEQE
jgi:signal transduction histidine kinase